MASIHALPPRAQAFATRLWSKKRALTVLLALSCSRMDTPLDSPEIEQLSIAGAVDALAVADTVRLTAVGTASDGATVENPEVTWTSSDRTIATVDREGLVFGVSFGAVDIVASLPDQAAVYRLHITRPVTGPALLLTGADVEVAKVSVVPATATIGVGSTKTFTFTATDSSGTLLSGLAVTWASTAPGIAKVSSSGVVTGVAPGTAKIRATVDGRNGYASVTVTETAVASVSVTPAVDTTAIGQSVTYVAKAKSASGAVLDVPIKWTSLYPTIAKVSTTGVVTGLNVGIAKIRAEAGGKYTDASVKVILGNPLSSIVLSPGSASLEAGKTLALSAVAKLLSGSLTVVPLTWSSSNPAVATVSSSGVVTAVAAGTAKIKAASGLISGTSSITVTAPSSTTVASITVTPTIDTTAVGKSITYIAKAKNSSGVVLNVPIKWSSLHPTIAKVSSTGVVTGLAVGIAKIRAEAGGKYKDASATVKLSLTTSTLSSIVLSPASGSLEKGSTLALSAVAKLLDGTIVTVPLTWSSSNSAVATVSTSGVVSGVAAGSATIRATSGSISGSAAITVTVPDTTTTSNVTVSLTAAAGSVAAGGSTTLSWTVKNATSCVATGGWTGSKAMTGSQSTGALARTMDFGLTCSGAGGSAGATAVVVVSRPAAPRYPLKVNSTGRYLVDADGKPYLINADAAWSLMVRPTREQADAYLEDRRARGFNAVLVNLVEHYFADSPPKNIYGDSPFKTAGDFSTPNETYFGHAEYVIRKAAEKGMLVMLAPAYLGASGGSEGWYQEMLDNGATKLRTYGAYVAKRFQAYNNIFWIEGGDYRPPVMSVVNAVAEGIRSIDTKWLHTFHGSRGTSALGFLGTSQSWLTVNNAYTGAAVVERALLEYNRSTMPYFLIEAVYENAGGDEVDVRRQAYQANLSGATGQIMGNRPIWPFERGWQEALSSGGSVTLQHMQRILEARKWWTLVPDQSHVLLTAGLGAAPEEAVAAKTPDGMLAIVYIPTTRNITLNLSKLVGPKVVARWYDPTSGKFTTAKGGFLSRTAPVVLTTPGKNARGFTDWVLVLESAN